MDTTIAAAVAERPMFKAEVFVQELLHDWHCLLLMHCWTERVPHATGTGAACTGCCCCCCCTAWWSNWWLELGEGEGDLQDTQAADNRSAHMCEQACCGGATAAWV